MNPQSLPAPDEGIEILVEMAKTAQIDPWDVDIVRVADAYLSEVEKRQTDDLQLHGKTLLYLAILLRMKSDLLAGLDPWAVETDNEFFDALLDEDGVAAEGAGAPLKLVQPFKPKTLDEVLQRRTSIKQPRIRRVTLDDLIGELKKYEALERQRSMKRQIEAEERRRDTMVDYGDFTVDDIDNMAHEESLDDSIERLSMILGRMLQADPEARIPLSQIQELGAVDRITAFLCLLFLEARGEVDVEQDHFYSDELWVRADKGDFGLAQQEEEPAPERKRKKKEKDGSEAA